jgi:hypothetical protein
MPVYRPPSIAVSFNYINMNNGQLRTSEGRSAGFMKFPGTIA